MGSLIGMVRRAVSVVAAGRSWVIVSSWLGIPILDIPALWRIVFVGVPLVVRALSVVGAASAITSTSTTTASAMTVVVVVALLLLIAVRRMRVGAVPTGHITVAV